MVICLKCLFSVCAAGHEGTFDPANVGGGCTACAAGKFSAAAGGTCTDCAAGTFSPAAGSTSCTDCNADEFSATAAAAACTTCDATSETTDSYTGQSACGETNVDFFGGF